MCPFSESKHLLDTILPALLGGLIAGFVGVWLASWQRKRDARNQFLVTMSLAKSAIPEDNIFEGFRHSLHVVKEAVYRVLPFLGKSRARRLLEEWQGYSGLDETQLMDRNEDDSWRIALKAGNQDMPPKPSEVLKGFFERMSKIVR